MGVSMSVVAAEPPPLVSVLVPAYNAATTIGETLASACSQTHTRLEIIVVDDGSVDQTARVVLQAASEDSRIRLVKQANAGVAAARNTALAHATGEFVAPLDADDIWRPTKIERQLKRILGNSNVGMVYCWSLDIDGSSRVVKRRLDYDRFEGDVYAALVLSNFVGNGSAPLLRRDLVAEIGGWDTSLRRMRAQGCEDWKLYLKIAERSLVALEPAFLVGYRQSATAMSRSVDQMSRSYDRVISEARRSHPELPSTLFRWSRAGFHRYAAALLFESGNWPSAVIRLAQTAVLDPAYLRRRSVRRKLESLLAASFGRKPKAEIRYPIGLALSEVSEEAGLSVSASPIQSSRRELVAKIRILREKYN
jgi:GT2 family glycosyltransferase